MSVSKAPTTSSRKYVDNWGDIFNKSNSEVEEQESTEDASSEKQQENK